MKISKTGVILDNDGERNAALNALDFAKESLLKADPDSVDIHIELKTGLLQSVRPIFGEKGNVYQSPHIMYLKRALCYFVSLEDMAAPLPLYGDMLCAEIQALREQQAERRAARQMILKINQRDVEEFVSWLDDDKVNAQDFMIGQFGALPPVGDPDEM